MIKNNVLTIRTVSTYTGKSHCWTRKKSRRIDALIIKLIMLKRIKLSNVKGLLKMNVMMMKTAGMFSGKKL
jgi:hypothetical protein